MKNAFTGHIFGSSGPWGDLIAFKSVAWSKYCTLKKEGVNVGDWPSFRQAETDRLAGKRGSKSKPEIPMMNGLSDRSQALLNQPKNHISISTKADAIKHAKLQKAGI